MLPFGVYSVFHVATYSRTNLIPTINPPAAVVPPAGTSPSAKPTYKASPLAERIGHFVKDYYDQSMGLVAILEIVLWFRLLGSAIIFTRGSWILLTLYTAFLRARLSQSSFVKFQFQNLSARVDALVGGQGIPPAARQVWETIKNGAKQFHDATDVGRYVGRGPAPAKKSS
ncbi:hypothetical protein V491_05488 [Pseudogymnoascus sp. VKM F-3775]|nr:hypothetical protein V491_05488 [Pseudogymnoascus sp. VKM F-3775]